MFQCIWKRQPGFTKVVWFPFSVCCFMCCKATGNSFFMTAYLPMLGWGFWPWACDTECRDCHLTVTFFISDKCVEGQGAVCFRHRAKSVQADKEEESKGCDTWSECTASACLAPEAHQENSSRGTGGLLCQDCPKQLFHRTLCWRQLVVREKFSAWWKSENWKKIRQREDKHEKTYRQSS